MQPVKVSFIASGHEVSPDTVETTEFLRAAVAYFEFLQTELGRPASGAAIKGVSIKSGSACLAANVEGASHASVVSADDAIRRKIVDENCEEVPAKKLRAALGDMKGRQFATAIDGNVVSLDFLLGTVRPAYREIREFKVILQGVFSEKNKFKIKVQETLRKNEFKLDVEREQAKTLGSLLFEQMYLKAHLNLDKSFLPRGGKLLSFVHCRRAITGGEFLDLISRHASYKTVDDFLRQERDRHDVHS